MRATNQSIIKSFYIELLESFKANKLAMSFIFISSFIVNCFALAFPFALVYTFDIYINDPKNSLLTIILSTVAALLTLEILIRICRQIICAWIDTKKQYKINLSYFKNLIGLSQEEFSNKSSGEHINLIQQYNQSKSFNLGYSLITIIDLPFILIFLLAIMYLGGNLVLATVATLMIPIIYLKISYKKNLCLLEKSNEANSRKLDFLIDSFEDLFSVKALGIENILQRRFEKLQNRISKEQIHELKLNQNIYQISEILPHIALSSTIIFGAYLAMSGSISFGELAACIILSGRCVFNFTKTLTLWNKIVSEKFIESKLNLSNNMPCRETNNKYNNDRKYKIEKGLINIKNISLGNNTLNNINLIIEPHNTIGISSKDNQTIDSFYKLILGLAKPYYGSVEIDGINIGLYEESEIRNNIAYISDNSHIFSGTIIENLSKFNKSHEEKAKKIAEDLGLNPEILKLSDGYNTQVDNNSIKVLSKGLIQKIAIIRELILEPKIILINNNLISIDSESNTKLFGYLHNLKQKPTILIANKRSGFDSENISFNVDCGRSYNDNGC